MRTVVLAGLRPSRTTVKASLRTDPRKASHEGRRQSCRLCTYAESARPTGDVGLCTYAGVLRGYS